MLINRISLEVYWDDLSEFVCLASDKMETNFPLTNDIAFTLLHQPGAAYRTRSSCQEHRRAPSHFSETSPSANNAHFDALWWNIWVFIFPETD